MQGFYKPEVYENGRMDISDYEEELELVDLPEGQSVNVVFAMPFLDHNPLAATEYAWLEYFLLGGYHNFRSFVFPTFFRSGFALHKHVFMGQVYFHSLAEEETAQ